MTTPAAEAADPAPPTVSYGIILFTVVNGEVKYLICQRKDSISYIVVLKNLFGPGEEEKYINSMSREEKERCVRYKDDPLVLWDDMWINHNIKKYIVNKDKFLSVFPRTVNNHIDAFRSPECRDLEWEFPKGRKNKRKETELQCAKREFREETTISPRLITVLPVDPVVEAYVGMNGKTYENRYFVAYIDYRSIPAVTKRRNEHSALERYFVTPEVRDIKWAGPAELDKYLSPRKLAIVARLEGVVDRFKVALPPLCAKGRQPRLARYSLRASARPPVGLPAHHHHHTHHSFPYRFD